MIDKEFLKMLLDTPSPSGLEKELTDKLADYMNKYYGSICDIDKIGNSIYSLGCGKTKIMLSGHIDEVGLIVQYINEDGFISVISSGGMDPLVLPGSTVRLLGDYGDVDGVVGKTPIHLIDYGDSDYLETLNDMSKVRIDVGCSTKKEVEDLGIHVGTRVVYQRNNNVNFGDNRIVGQGLDDKVSIYIIFKIFEKLIQSINGNPEDWTSKYTIYVVSTTQEETGLRGATVAAQNIKPDISIDLDVTFATDDDRDINISEVGEVKLGKGFVIDYGPDKSVRLANLVRDSAKDLKVDTQLIASGCGGTNTSAIQLFGGNCETLLLSIPNRNMHTPVEVCDWRDINGVIEVITNIIINQKINV